MSQQIAHGRARYAPELSAFLADLDARGLSDVVRSGRTTDCTHMSALAGLGLVRSGTIRAGCEVWRLHFTKIGRAVRKLLLAEAARA